MILKNIKKIKYGIITSFLVSVSIVMASCDNNNDSVSSTDLDLRSLIKTAGLTGDPTTGRTLPVITDAKAQLGMKLFFTKGLGADKDAACVTCHHPNLGGGDNLALPIGVDGEVNDLLGPGRFHDAAKVAEPTVGGGHFDAGPTVPRNAPTTFNIALWDKVLFHDGRIESIDKTAGVNGDSAGGIRTPDSDFGVADTNAGANLPTSQARFPVTSPEEMRGFDPAHGIGNAGIRTTLETRLGTDWNSEFNTAFGDSLGVNTYGRIAEAIGEYERSQTFVDSPFKAFVEGDDSAISDSAKRGALDFFNSIADGGANCVSCHSGDFMSDESFHVLAVPQIGRGKGDGTFGDDDFGRFRETGNPADMYKFRTPSLLNVEVTGPWGHSGAYSSLEAIVRHHLNASDAVANYDFSQLDPNLQASNMTINTNLHVAQLEKNRIANVANVLQDVVMTDSEVTDMVNFLKSLTDPCTKSKSCMSAWIPDSSDTNPDGLRLNAIDKDGNFL